MPCEVSVDATGAFLTVLLRGVPSPELLRSCHERVLSLVRDGNEGNVLYDARGLKPPPASTDFVWIQRELDAASDGLVIRRAILVADSRVAYLARLAFADGRSRIFYDSLDTAVRWLTGNDGAGPVGRGERDS